MIQDLFGRMADFNSETGNIPDKPGTSDHTRKQVVMKDYWIYCQKLSSQPEEFTLANCKNS